MGIYRGHKGIYRGYRVYIDIEDKERIREDIERIEGYM